MEWLSPEFVRSLTAPGVLLLGSVFLIVVVFRDRNARIRDTREDRDARLEDKDDQIRKLWEALGASETARDRQADGLREALDASRTAVSAVEGLRSAVERTIRDQQRDEGLS